jgi:hypothetical protein
MRLLGKTIDMTDPEWVNQISDMIATAKEAEFIGDMSMIAHALVTEIAITQEAPLEKVKVLMRTDPDGTIIQAVYKHDVDEAEVEDFMEEAFSSSAFSSMEWEWETETVESKPII